jgi:hypothetical protein
MQFEWLLRWWKKGVTYRNKAPHMRRIRLRVEPLEERWCPSTLGSPVITMDPASVTVDAGQVATLTAAASGMPAPMVQWEISTDGGQHFRPIMGATRATYRLVASAALNGAEYEAVFANRFGRATTHAATLTVDFAPVVTLNPLSQTVAVGSQVTLTAAAKADPAATVQWQISTDGGKSYQDIAGANSTTLTVTAPAAVGNVRFRAVFTNTLGHATTRVAVVRTRVPPAVTADPVSQTVNAGSLVTFTAAADGTALLVQWQVSTDGGRTFVNIMGATGKTLIFRALASENGHVYRAVFTNVLGRVATAAATLTVDFAPAVTKNPLSQRVAAGDQITLMAAAVSDPTATVQWQVSTDGGKTYQNIAGANSTTLTLTAPGGEGSERFHAVFSNPLGTVTTRAAVVRIDVPPAITHNPTNQTVNAGNMVTFTVAASGSLAPSVQWQVSTDGGRTFRIVMGATGSSYSWVATASQNGFQYRAVITNAAGTITSQAATLRVI